MFYQGSHHPCVAFAGGHHQGGGGGHQAGPFLDKGVQQVRKVLGTSLLGSAPEARSSLVVSALPLLAASHRSQLSWEESRGTGLELMRGLAENSWGIKLEGEVSKHSMDLVLPLKICMSSSYFLILSIHKLSHDIWPSPISIKVSTLSR